MENTITILTVFTGIAALAFVFQAVALLVISRKIRDLSVRLDALSTTLTKQIDSLSAQAGHFLSIANGLAEKVQAVQQHVAAVSEVVHKRVLEVDTFLTEVTDSARLQMARLQDVVDTTSRKIDETIDTLQTAILAPVAEVQAIIRGVRSGLDVLFGWRRSSSSRSHQDEEMFI